MLRLWCDYKLCCVCGVIKCECVRLILTEKKLASKCSRVINMSTSSTRPPSCMYCFGELSPMEGTPANMLFPSERDSASSRSRPPPSARFLKDKPRDMSHQSQTTGHMFQLVYKGCSVLYLM